MKMSTALFSPMFKCPVILRRDMFAYNLINGKLIDYATFYQTILICTVRIILTISSLRCMTVVIHSTTQTFENIKVGYSI